MGKMSKIICVNTQVSGELMLQLRQKSYATCTECSTDSDNNCFICHHVELLSNSVTHRHNKLALAAIANSKCHTKNELTNRQNYGKNVKWCKVITVSNRDNKMGYKAQRQHLTSSALYQRTSNERTVQRQFKKFREGDESFEGKKRSAFG
ncbi:hypothetical protein KIN20_015102 [Parelaphostrongylus tenuis]|uniref:Uncharacterized protein n=1 Tax=Parelaphostrongylus tenuis TaxID=148309 RepID=A0AAD5N3V7_PARTN|nr:hypothetical protein KIN20_015102 [Parelaphostrongylus tenuis]